MQMTMKKLWKRSIWPETYGPGAVRAREVCGSSYFLFVVMHEYFFEARLADVQVFYVTFCKLFQ